jgi:hypothetical protein
MKFDLFVGYIVVSASCRTKCYTISVSGLIILNRNDCPRSFSDLPFDYRLRGNVTSARWLIRYRIAEYFLTLGVGVVGVIPKSGGSISLNNRGSL